MVSSKEAITAVIDVMEAEWDRIQSLIYALRREADRINRERERWINILEQDDE